MKSRSRLTLLARHAAGHLCAMALCGTAYAQLRSYDIAAGELKAALDAYALQSGAQVIYKTEDVRGRSTKGLGKRTLSADEALAVLLEGTQLSVRRDVSGAVMIFAAPPPPPPPEKRGDADVNALDAVIVTASRRNEPVREVPMQVNVMSAESLDRSGAKSLRDYLSTEAGVELKSAGGPGMGSISMRGVSTGAQTIATVGVYVDDVAFGSSSPFANGPQQALDMALLDLNHIELLRGPQGTLYGAGAMGGLLKYVTNEPDTYEFSGKASLTASTTRNGGANSTASAVVNMPLKEDVAGLRVSAFGDRVGGTVDAAGPAAQKNVDRGSTTGARVSLLLTPSSKFKIRTTATTQSIRRDGTDFVDYNGATGQPIVNDQTRTLKVREPYSIKIDLFSADVEYDFGDARLNSITSKQRLRSHVVSDLSAGFVPLLASMGLAVDSASVDVHVKVDKATQEFRLTSKSDAQLEWLAGLYYDYESVGNAQDAVTTLAGGAPGPLLLSAAIPSTYRELALYGDVTWKFGPDWSLTGGLRVARNEQHYRQSGDGLLGGGMQGVSVDSGDTSKTYLLTARYRLTPASDVYARVATGYRPGGPNAVAGNPAIPATFQPDSLTSYETGYKADLLDKALSVQAAVYDIEWKDLQQYMPVNGLSIIVNAGAARVRGAELSVSWRPDARWTLTGNASAIDARLSEDAQGLGGVRGDRLPTSARFAAALSVNHSFELAGHAGYAGLTQRYVGQRNSGFDGSAALPNFRLPAYSLTDLQAGIDFKRASIAFFVRNLFDARGLTSANDAVRVLGGPLWVSLVQPRTLGATVTVPF